MSTGRMGGIAVRIHDRHLCIVYEGTATNDETGEGYAVTLYTSEQKLRALVEDIAAANRDMTDEQLMDVLLSRLEGEAGKG